MSFADKAKLSRSLFAIRRWPLALRLTGWYALASFSIILLATWLLYWTLASILQHQDEQYLSNKLAVLRALLLAKPQDQQTLRQEVDEDVTSPRVLYARVLSRDGATLYEATGMSGALPVSLFPRAGIGQSAEVRSAAGVRFRVVSANAGSGSSSQAESVVIQVAIEVDTTADMLASYRWVLFLGAVVSWAACAAAGYQIAVRGMQPLERIRHVTSALSVTTLHQRVPTGGLSGEMLELAEAFNGTLERMEASFVRLMQFSDDLAHELRGPLGNALGSIELALVRVRSAEEYADLLGSAHEELERLSRTINSLLFLARSDNPATIVEKETLDLPQEVRTVLDFFDAPASEGGVTLNARLEAGMRIVADRSLLRRVLHNVVANAVAHTPSGGTVTVGAFLLPGAVRIDVADSGCGIATEHMPFIFDRFYRAEPSRPRAGDHVGLGLAIVRSIMTLHGGTVSATSEVGVGTVFHLAFPQPDGPAAKMTES